MRLGRAAGLRFEGDAGAFGQAADGVHEINVLIFANEGENVAALVAAEAMKELALGADVEAGGFFLVEGAEGDEVGAGAFEGDVAADDVHNIAGGADLFDWWRGKSSHPGPAAAGLFVGRPDDLIDHVPRFLRGGFGSFHLVGRDGCDEDKGQMALHLGSGEGLEEDGLLDGAVSGETNILQVLFLHGLVGRQFLLGHDAGIHQGQRGDQHAGETHHAAQHSQIILGAPEHVAAEQFFTKHLPQPGKNQQNPQRDQEPARQVRPERSERARNVLPEEGAERAVKRGGQTQNGQPFEHGQKLLGHALLAPAEQPDDKPDNDEQVEVAERERADPFLEIGVHRKSKDNGLGPNLRIENEARLAPGRLLGGGGFGGVLFFLADDGGDGLEFVGAVQVDQFHALGVAAGFADVVDAGAHHLAGDGDEHDLVVSLDSERAHDVAGLLGGFHGDDALAGAGLAGGIRRNRCVCRCRSRRRPAAWRPGHHQGQGDHGVGFFQGDAADARRRDGPWSGRPPRRSGCSGLRG